MTCIAKVSRVAPIGLTLLLLDMGSGIAIYVNVLASLSVVSHSVTVLHTVNNGFESLRRSKSGVLAPKKVSRNKTSRIPLHSCLIH